MKRGKPQRPRGAGRPPIAGTTARETFQLRVTSEQRAPWQASAAASGQSESEWARDGLDAWVRFCARAAELGTNPQQLVDAALEDHARVRAAVAELASVRSLSKTESRLFRILAPAEWAQTQAP
jgi:hypothetical protein